MFLVNKSSLSTNDIKSAVVGYPIDIHVIDDANIIEDTQGVFVDNARGLLVTNDAYKNFGGLTYEYGATSVYDVADTLKRLGDRLGRRVLALRIIHECLHHFALPADDMDTWFAQHPVWCVLYYVFGRPCGESWLSCYIQEMYYIELFSTISSESEFDKVKYMDDRAYNGLQKN